MNASPSITAASSPLSLSTQNPKRIAVVDDVAIIRAVFRSIAEDSPGMNLIWTASNLDEARAGLNREVPDLLVMDVNLPDGDGFEFTTELLQTHPGLPVLIFSAHEGGSFVEKAVECGARGFLGKNVPPQKVVEAISILCSGGTFIEKY
jgi:DNA-binding NarL/FixJ family response regulator